MKYKRQGGGKNNIQPYAQKILIEKNVSASVKGKSVQLCYSLLRDVGTCVQAGQAYRIVLFSHYHDGAFTRNEGSHVVKNSKTKDSNATAFFVC